MLLMLQTWDQTYIGHIKEVLKPLGQANTLTKKNKIFKYLKKLKNNKCSFLF